jgi:hypothetical protein
VSGIVPQPRVAADEAGQPVPQPPLGRLWARPCARCGCSRYAHAHHRGRQEFTVAGCAVCGCAAFSWPRRRRRLLAELPGAKWRTRLLLGYMQATWNDRYDIIPSYAGWSAIPWHGDGTPIRAPRLDVLHQMITADWDERVLRRKRRDALMAALEKVGRPDA